MSVVLGVSHLCKAFGGVRAVDDVSFAIEAGTLVALIGPNGAGKTTCFNCINGQLRPDDGTVELGDTRIDGLAPHQIARRGVGYVPEGREIFPTLTVRENLLLGEKSARAAGRWSLDDMFGLFPRLRERADTPGGVLSGGEQQMLTIC